MNLLSGKAHGEKGKEPCNQRGSSSCSQAIPTPDTDVMGSSKHRGQAHHAGDECQSHEGGSDAVACTAQPEE